jgi:hypothetical protein
MTTPCLPNPQDDPVFRVVRVRANQPTQVFDFLGTIPQGWTSKARDWTNYKPEIAKLKQLFPKNNEAFWKRESNFQYFWIESRIRLDDTIEQIKRKIIFALATSNPNEATQKPLTSYLELWVQTPANTPWTPIEKPTTTNDINSKSKKQNQTKQTLQFLRLGERFNGFPGDVSLSTPKSKPNIDTKHFLTSSGKTRTDLVPTDENDRLLHDFLDEINQKALNHTIFLHNLQDAWKYLKLPDNNETRYAFYQKYWPYANLPPAESLSNRDYQAIQTFIKYEQTVFEHVDEQPVNESKLFKNDCLIEKLEIHINPQLNTERIDLFKLWYVIHLDDRTVFKRYKDPDETPVYKFYKPFIKEKKIPAKQSFSWIGLATSSDARFREARVPENTLTVKRFLYEGKDGARFATIHIKPEGQVMMDLSFQGKPEGGATPAEVNEALQAQLKWLSSAHQSFDIRVDRRPSISRTNPIPTGQYTFNQKNGEFTWGENIKLIGLQLMLVAPPKQPWVKPDFQNDLKKFMDAYPLLVVPDLRQTARDLAKEPGRRPNELVYRYTRISNYSNMKDRYVTIQETILENPSLERAAMVQEIVRRLIDAYNLTEEMALSTFQEWDQLYGFTLASQAARLLRQTGLVVRFSPQRIQLHGIRDGWLGHRALSILWRLWNRFMEKAKPTAEFTKLASAYQRGEKTEEHIRTQTSLGVGMMSSSNLYQQALNTDFTFGDEFSSEFLTQVIANSESINRNLVPASQTNNAGENRNESGRVKLPPGMLNPETLGKDMGLNQYCTGEEADTERQVCKDICMDDKYVLRRLQLYDPTLFSYTKSGTGVKHSYSQACQKPSQPIVVPYDPETNPRVEPGSITYALRYGSEPTRQFWYICPQAWCPYEEIPIPFDLVKDKVQLRKIKGGEVCRAALCPSCEKNLKRETWLRLLNVDAQQHIYPGFNDKSAHPQDLCLPCCYSIDSRDKSKKHHSRMLKCLGEEDESAATDQGKDYLLGREKVPLPGDRFGVLTAPLQEFFMEYCDAGYLPSGKGCIVRRGISSPEGQPLLDSIHYLDQAMSRKGAEWIHKTPPGKKTKRSAKKQTNQQGGANNNNENANENTNEVMISNELLEEIEQANQEEPETSSIMTKRSKTAEQDFKKWLETLINRFPKDDFYSLARGQLVRYFQPNPIPAEWAKLSPNEFYNKLQDTAYENWKEFVLNPTERVPLSIIWDFLQRPGTLTPDGINIFIIRGDQVLCPLGDDVGELFQEDRPSLFILTNHDESSFEPIVRLDNRAGLFYVNPVFPPKHPLAMRLMEHIQTMCAPQASIDWNRVRKDYAPNVPIHVPKKQKPTLRQLREKIAPRDLPKWKQWADPLHQISGLLSPEGYLLPAQPARPLSNVQVAQTTLPVHSYMETLKAYQEFAKRFGETGYEPARMSVLPNDPNQVVGIQLGNEYVIPTTPTDTKKIPSGKQLPPTMSYLDQTVNRELIQQNQVANNRVRTVSKQAYLNESYQRLRFTLGRALGENPNVREELMTIIAYPDIATKENEKRVSQIVQRSLVDVLSKAPKRAGFDLADYTVPNIRELCHLTVPRGAKNAKQLCEETMHCAYSGGKCQLWIPNLEPASAKATTQEKLLRRIVKELVLNPFKREEVVFNRVEDFLNKSKIEVENDEILLQGEGTAPYTKLVAEYKPKKKITSQFAQPTYQTAQPQLSSENRERYRRHLGSRRETLQAFVPKIAPVPNHWEEKLGKGYLMRQGDKVFDQFFLALRGTAEDVYDRFQNDKSKEANAWTIWAFQSQQKKGKNMGRSLEPPASWTMTLEQWKKWYREHLEMITPEDMLAFAGALDIQHTGNKKHPYTKQLREGVKAIQEETKEKEQSVRALALMKLVWRLFVGTTVARNLQLWADVQKYLDRGDYPITDFDFYVLNRFLGFHVCVLEQRKSTTLHPSGFSWYRAESMNAPVYMVYVERLNVMAVHVLELQNHLLLPLPTFTQQAQKWIQDAWKKLPATDLWSQQKKASPWELGRKVSWEKNSNQKFKRELK